MTNNLINSTKITKGTRFERMRMARIMAVQAIYQANYYEQDYSEISRNFFIENIDILNLLIKPEQSLFISIIDAIVDNKEKINKCIEDFSIDNWHSNNTDSMHLTILQVAIAELLSDNLPKKNAVIISEYIEITKGFLGIKASGYTNKILDKIVNTINNVKL